MYFCMKIKYENCIASKLQAVNKKLYAISLHNFVKQIQMNEVYFFDAITESCIQIEYKVINTMII